MKSIEATVLEIFEKYQFFEKIAFSKTRYFMKWWRKYFKNRCGFVEGENID